MELSNQILSDITIFNKYAKFIPDLNRRETWDEICDRYEQMMLNKYPKLSSEIVSNMKYIRDKKVLPSMRAMQFAGAAITKNNSRLYNCAYFPVDDYRAFSEAMFLLLGGTGIGYSVQFHHIEHLPEILKPTKEKKYLIGDSLEGWADAVKALVKAYFGISRYKPRFDYTDIRPKGARLKTAGGKAPGPAPLRELLVKIEGIFEGYNNGDKLKSIDVHRIMCHIANSVLSGGIRRSAMIALFSFDDEEMLECKYGNWWEKDECFGRANNSAVIIRNKVTQEEFLELWKKIELSNAGEPGIYFTNDKDWGTNPCCEIALKPYSFCNLCEVNVSDVENQRDLEDRIGVAAFFGTLQAGYTDFHYLRPIWRTTTEKDALIGVGMTGIASNKLETLDLKKAVEHSKIVNDVVSKFIGINNAARVSTIKPSGTTSCVLGTSSGIHAWHNDYYIRRIRIMKNDPLYTYLIIHHPELVEDDVMRTHDTACICIPQKAPEGAILRTENALELLERVKKFNLEWVREGHRRGANTNNVSATISIKSEKIIAVDLANLEKSKTIESNEWESVGQWMWTNKATFNGLSVLPMDNGSYVQAPFTDCTEQEFNEQMKHLTALDLTKVVEMDDNTEHSQEAACAGGACEVK